MKKYLQIIKSTWAEYMVYRLNFVLWRVRQVMQILIVYFLWWAIFSTNAQLFGYTQAKILTYVLLSSVVRTIVLGTTTIEIGGLINQGNLSNYIIRPIKFFRYYLARDIADKALNFLFALGEIALLYMLLRPPVFIQQDPVLLILALVAVGIGAAAYFCFSLLLGFLGFWTPDIWGPRFISFVIMEFFAGGLFPLDILPGPLYVLSQSLPFYYFVYFPIKVYLGDISSAFMLQGFIVGVLWVIGLWYVTKLVWKRGMRVYAAEGK